MGTAAAKDNDVRDMNTIFQMTGPSHEMKSQEKKVKDNFSLFSGCINCCDLMLSNFVSC